MTDNLLRSYGVRRDWLKIIINSELVLLDINKAIPCGLIVNELVSNAIKHGFPNHRAGEIRIDFHKADNKFVLTVSNNGVQFPPDLDINNCSTLGLELVSSLCRQLKGKLSLIREGITEFQLEFRL